MSEIILKPKLGFSTFQEGWVYKTFGEFVTNKSKKHNPKSSDTDYKCVELEHLESNTGRLLGFISSKGTNSTKNSFTKNQVLYGKLRPYLNKYHYTKFDGVCSSEIWVLDGINFNNEFLSHLTQTPYFKYVTLKTTGSKMPRADWNVLSETEFCVPTSLPEQQKIADYLTTIDKKIELLKDKKEELSRYKKAMMQKLFSQEIRFKDENGNDYPEWEKKIRLTDIAKISIGVVTTMTENYRDFGTKLIRNSDISPMKLSDSLIYLDNSFSELYENRKLHKGDIVTVHTGNVGVSAVIEDSFIGSIGFATINTRPNVSIVNSYFLAYYFNSKKFINWCIAYSTGDGRRNLNLKDFNKVILDLPSLPEQQKIANFLSAIDESITKVEEQIKETQNFKKAMLQQLFV